MLWTLATKVGDEATTSDEWRVAPSRLVTWQSPPGVKGAIEPDYGTTGTEQL